LVIPVFTATADTKSAFLNLTELIAMGAFMITQE
jgi:hypothetical protein